MATKPAKKAVAKKAAPKKYNSGGLLAPTSNTGAKMPAAPKTMDGPSPLNTTARTPMGMKPIPMARPRKAIGRPEFNSGGDVKTGYDKGIKARTVMSDAVRRRMEASGLEEPMLTKKTPVKAAETSQYAGKKLQVSAERKAKQEAEKKRLLNKPLD